MEDNIVNMLSSIYRRQEAYSYIATLLHNAYVDTKAIKKLFEKAISRTDYDDKGK